MSMNLPANFDLNVSFSADLAESQDRIVTVFEHKGIRIRPEISYVIKSSGNVPAKLILEFLKHVGEHEIEHVLDSLTDAAFLAIGLAISKVRALLSDRTLFVHVMTRARSSDRVHYHVLESPEEKRALKAIKAFQRNPPDTARRDVFWHEHKWVTAAEKLSCPIAKHTRVGAGLSVVAQERTAEPIAVEMPVATRSAFLLTRPPQTRCCGYSECLKNSV